MKKISDFNSATEKYPVIYAGSASRPEYVDMPTTLQQQEGVAPMDTLPAQWWNAMWKLATKDINAFRDYVGDAFTEINNLLTKFGITLEDADSEQLYDFFHNDYVQNYLNNIFVNKSGDTIEGDLHIKGNLSVDGIGEEIISTELKVGANTITLRNGNPSALGNTELAGVVTKNYDGNNHNNIISIDKNGVARTGDIDIATRILYSNNGTNFFTDEELTIGATIGENEELRDTGNQTSSGVKIYEGVTYSNNDTQAIATREDELVDGALLKWDASSKKLVSANIESDVKVGTLIQQYKKVPMSGYLYCDGSTFNENDYPELYMYLGTNVLPDYRECVMVGAEQNTTDTIATHDVYGEGEFKDDQLKSHKHDIMNDNPNGYEGYSVQYSNTGFRDNLYTEENEGGGTTTHGKQKAVYVYIKATSGLTENQQKNVLNDAKNYINNSNSYSTDEVKTGEKWIDGKPIYRKVVDFGALPNATTKTVTFDTVSADTWVNVMALAKSTDGTVINIPYADTSAASHSIAYVINDGRIQVNTGSVDRSGYNKCYFKLEYTKTTD